MMLILGLVAYIGLGVATYNDLEDKPKGLDKYTVVACWPFVILSCLIDEVL